MSSGSFKNNVTYKLFTNRSHTHTHTHTHTHIYIYIYIHIYIYIYILNIQSVSKDGSCRLFFT